MPYHAAQVALPLAGAAGLLSLEGVVERLLFENADTGYRVLAVRADDDAGSETWVGIVAPVIAGMRVLGTGRRVPSRRKGAEPGETQIELTRLDAVLPTTPAGILRYLASAKIPGVAAVTAAKIVDAFGAATFAVLDGEDAGARLLGIVGKKKIPGIVAAWAEQRALAPVLALLRQHGASPTIAKRIVEAYGAKAPAVVAGEPYRLAIEIEGVGFLTADAIARSAGLPLDSPDRAMAGILHVLAEQAMGGHCYMPEGLLVAGNRHERVVGVTQLLGVDVGLVYPAIASLVANRRIVVEDVQGPDAEGDERIVYLRRFHEAETAVALRLRQLATAPPRPVRLPEGMTLDAVVEREIALYERQSGTTLAPEQRAAVELAARGKVVVVTGGPGVGKSTITRAILAVYRAIGVTVRLASPTGKASQRLAEATGMPAETIHRLLGAKGGNYFARDPKNVVPAEEGGSAPAGCVIVDEASMVDLLLADKLLAALDDGTRLVLVGDVDQLPSVGAGAVLADAISGGVPTVRLTRIFRQGPGSTIATNAARINRGEAPVGDPMTRRGEALGRPRSRAPAELPLEARVAAAIRLLDSVRVRCTETPLKPATAYVVDRLGNSERRALWMAEHVSAIGLAEAIEAGDVAVRQAGEGS